MAEPKIVTLWPMNPDTFPHRVINTDASPVQLVFDEMKNEKFIVAPFDGKVAQVKLDYNPRKSDTIGATTTETFLMALAGTKTPLKDAKDDLLGEVREDLLAVVANDTGMKVVFWGCLPDDLYLNVGQPIQKGSNIGRVRVRQPSNFGISYFDKDLNPILQTRLEYQFMGVGNKPEEPGVLKEVSWWVKGGIVVGGLWAVSKIIRG